MTEKTIYHRIKSLNARMAKNYQRGIGPTRMVLLLTTIGRKSGLPRTTPVQFEEIDGAYYVGSARGKDSDWFKNILANPNVHVQLRDRSFDSIAEAVTDPTRVAEFLAERLRRHPVMIHAIMTLAEGFPLRYTQADLEKYSQKKALVILRPRQD